MNFQNYNTIIKDILNNKIDNHKSIPFEKIHKLYKHDRFYSSQLIMIHEKYINFEELNRIFKYLPPHDFNVTIHNYCRQYYSIVFNFVTLYDYENIEWLLFSIIKDKNNFELVVSCDRFNNRNIYFRICDDILFIKSNYKEHIKNNFYHQHFITQFLQLNIKHLIMLGMYSLSIDLASNTIISFYTTCEKLGNNCLNNLTKLKYLIAPNCWFLYAPKHKLELVYAPKLDNIFIFSKSVLNNFHIDTLYAPEFKQKYCNRFNLECVYKNLIGVNSYVDIFKSKFDYNWIIENSYLLQELKNDAKEYENVDEELKEVIKDIKDNILFNLLNNNYKNVLVCLLVEYFKEGEKIEEMNKLINNLIHLQLNIIIYPVIMITGKAFKAID